MAGEIRLDDVQVTVSIVIRRGNSHAGLRLAVGRITYSRFDGNIGGGGVAVVVVQRRRSGVVGDVDVRPAVVVEIGHQHPQSVRALRFQDAGLLADIGEIALAVVV